MLDIKVDEKIVNLMLEEAINKRVDQIVSEKYFLTYKELSGYLNISKPVIEDRLIKNGLKYYKVGSKYLFKKSEVNDFLDKITSIMNETNNDLKFFNRLKECIN